MKHSPDNCTIAEAVGRAVISGEHRHFVAFPLDNREHIPRIRRIAHAVSLALADLGESRPSTMALSEALIEYGKRLFLDEWMSDLGEDENPEQVLSAGAAKFDHIMAEEEM